MGDQNAVNPRADNFSGIREPLLEEGIATRSVTANSKNEQKGRIRDRREAQALGYLRRKGCASALELGNAAVQGERRSRKISQQGKESIGLSIAVTLVRNGIIKTTRGNQFRLP
jgi:hypothetical protein